MRLNRQSEIAIGILAACARSPMRKIRTLQAAEASATTKDHAAQVVNLLVHEGFIRTERGRGGGIALAVPATEILLGDVLRRVQPDLVRHAGKDDPSGNNATLPVFDAIVGAAEATFLTFMDRFSIADLVSETGKIDCLDCGSSIPTAENAAKRTPSRPRFITRTTIRFTIRKNPLPGSSSRSAQERKEATIMSIRPADRSQHRQQAACILRAIIPVPAFVVAAMMVLTPAFAQENVGDQQAQSAITDGATNGDQPLTGTSERQATTGNAETVPVAAEGVVSDTAGTLPAVTQDASNDELVASGETPEPETEEEPAPSLLEDPAGAISHMLASSERRADLPHNLSPIGMFMAADRVVKAVMIGLALASLTTWTVWIAKTIEQIGRAHV